MNNCLYCNKETSNKKYCSLNCSGKGIGFQKGNITWNTGLTKETDSRLKYVSERVKLAQTGFKASIKTRKKLSKMKMGHPYYGGLGKCKFDCKCRKHYRNISEEEAKEKIRKALSIPGNRPNKYETILNSFLQENFPGEWKYVGNGEVIINRKNPDFININGKKAIIELWGDFFHRGQNPKDREKIFKEYGYKTLVIWASEIMKKPELLIPKIEKILK